MFLLLAGAIVMIIIKNLSLTDALKSYLSSLIDCLFFMHMYLEIYLFWPVIFFSEDSLKTGSR